MIEVVIRSRIKQLAENMHLSSSVFASLDNAIAELMAKAVRRAKENKRRTIFGRDV